MSRRGGKGRVSNDLVAASCAAVLTVYAAGYWRTRDVARRLEAQAQERRPARATVAAEAPVPAQQPVPEPPAIAVAAQPAPVAKPPAVPPAPKKAAKAVAAPSPAAPAPAPAPEPKSAAPPAIQSVPLEAEIKTPPLPPLDSLPLPAEKLVDGTYTGWGQSNHGDIEVQLVIRGGRIAESGVKTCATRYPCDVIDKILDQPVRRQNVNVDNVSRATESADAYYYGLLEALKQAIDE